MSDQILTPQQNQVLALIATGSTLSAAAEAAGIHRNTIANWRRTQPGFTEEFHEAQIEQTMHWRDQMQSLGALAVDALRAVLADEKATPSTRLKAALVVLNCITKPAQKAEIAAQLCTTDPQPTENKHRSDTPTAPAKSGFVPSMPKSTTQMPVFVGPLAEFKRKQWRVQHGLPAKVAK